MVAFSDVPACRGAGDHLCSAYYNNSACTQLGAGGWRYLVWPEKSDCCHGRALADLRPDKIYILATERIFVLRDTEYM